MSIEPMKLPRTLSMALALSVALLSLSFDSTASAQRQGKSSWDTGVVTLGPNQILRITMVNRGRADSSARFRRMEYSQGSCSDGLCKQSLLTEIAFPAVVLVPGESASIDISNTSFGVRGVALSNSPEMQVTGMIIDPAGEVVAFLDWFEDF